MNSLSEFTFEKFSADYASLIECELDRLLTFPFTDSRIILKDAMRYSTLAKGKRIRPLLSLCSSLLFSPQIKGMISLSASLEIMHTYSLIHDDLPSMDNDDLRRGIPTCHKRFNESTAILAGDALNTFVFEILATELIGYYKPEHILRGIALLSRSCGIMGMAGGQILDLTVKSASYEDIIQIHSLKTGALIQASLTIPAILQGVPSEIESTLSQFGYHLGLLFQMIDDILDVTSSSEILGKTALKDVAQFKSTFVQAKGLKWAKIFANEQVEFARKQLQILADHGYATYRLHAVLDYTLKRTA